MGGETWEAWEASGRVPTRWTGVRRTPWLAWSMTAANASRLLSSCVLVRWSERAVLQRVPASAGARIELEIRIGFGHTGSAVRLPDERDAPTRSEPSVDARAGTSGCRVDKGRECRVDKGRECRVDRDLGSGGGERVAQPRCCVLVSLGFECVTECRLGLGSTHVAE